METGDVFLGCINGHIRRLFLLLKGIELRVGRCRDILLRILFSIGWYLVNMASSWAKRIWEIKVRL